MHTVAGGNNFVQFVLYAYANTQGKGNEVNLNSESLWSVLASFRFLFWFNKMQLSCSAIAVVCTSSSSLRIKQQKQNESEKLTIIHQNPMT